MKFDSGVASRMARGYEAGPMLTALSRMISRIRGQPTPGAFGVARMSIPPEWRADFRADDQFLVSFPRSGNTWVRHLLRELLVMRRPDLAPPENLLELLPTVHHALPIAARHTEFGLHTRVIKSHNIADLTGRRMVYLFREPADALVSLFHHRVLRAAKGKVPAMTESLDDFCTRRIADWREHLALGLAERRGFPDRTHFTAYETLRADTPRALRGVVAFLGIEATDAQLTDATERCSFARLQAAEQKRKTHPGDELFFRKGRVGGGAEELQAATLRAIERACRALYREACDTVR